MPNPPSDATVKMSLWGRVGDRIRSSLRFPTRRPVILIAEDDPELRTYFEISLGRAGYATESATSGREALHSLQTRNYDAVVLDLLLPGVHGSTLLSDVRTNRPELMRRIVVATGLPEGALADAEGVAAILRKPFKIERLLEAIEVCRRTGS